MLRCGLLREQRDEFVPVPRDIEKISMCQLTERRIGTFELKRLLGINIFHDDGPVYQRSPAYAACSPMANDMRGTASFLKPKEWTFFTLLQKTTGDPTATTRMFAMASLPRRAATAFKALAAMIFPWLCPTTVA